MRPFSLPNRKHLPSPLQHIKEVNPNTLLHERQPTYIVLSIHYTLDPHFISLKKSNLVIDYLR